MMNKATVIPPQLYGFMLALLCIVVVAGIVGMLFVVLGNVLDRKSKKLRKDERVEKENRKESIKMLAISAGALIIGGSILSWSFLSGEDQIQRQLQAERTAVKVSEEASRYLIQGPSEQQIEDLVAGKAVEVEVATPEGYLERKPIQFYMGERLIDADTGSRWDTPVEDQRAWLLRGSIRDLALDRYGLALTDAQLDELKIPGAAPAVLTRYGSTPVTIPAEGGGYYNVDATLIWDGAWKLVGFPEAGGEELQELPALGMFPEGE